MISSVASAGDVNGDGFDDLIIGAVGADPNGSRSGTSYVFFGKAEGFGASLDLSTLDGATGFRMNGVAADDLSGLSVASAGDMNGDGFDDLIIGASGLPYGGTGPGASYVVFGKAGGFGPSLELSALNGTNGFRIYGEAAGDVFGWSVASAGDLNDDGYSDLIIGARGADPNGFDRSGASYVVYGKLGGFGASLDLATLDGTSGFKINGENEYDGFGESVASAGDVNGDGFVDLIIGAWRAGTSYVVFGTAGGFGASLNLSTLNGTTGFKINGELDSYLFGKSVASAGDVNGDGFDDLIIGAAWASPNGTGSGASYVVFGKAGGFGASVDVSALDGTNGFKINGEGEFDGLGWSVAPAGDVNGDGFDDLIIGATNAYTNGERTGVSYVIFGKAPDTAVERTGTAADNRILGGAFNDTLTGLAGDDTLTGGAGRDRLDGGAGDDILTGAAGRDRLDGGAGDDILTGGGDKDRMTGGTGNDIYVTDGHDTITEALNAGMDTVRSRVTFTLGANLEALVLTGSGAVNGTGNGLANTLTGNSAANVLEGGGGADTIIGRSGADTLDGGTGNDWLDGGRGRDVLTGGRGADSFVFNTAPGPANADRITDYNVAADTIRLENAVFTGLAAGVLAASAFAANLTGNAGDATDRVIYETDTGNLYFDRDGTGAAAKILFATLAPNLALTHADFLII